MNFEAMLLDLLCILHRDGGQHTQKVGIKQSFKEAMKLASDLVVGAERTPCECELCKDSFKRQF